MTIRVLVADDHGLVREGIVSVLRREPDLDVVAEAADGDEALAKVLSIRPAVAVIDVSMPGLGGIDLVHRLRAARVSTSVVLLSMHQDPAVILEGIDAGARAYVSKQALAHELIAAVRAAARQELYLSPRIARSVFDRARQGRPEAEPALNDREREVVALLSRGLTSKEIARAVKLSPRTVDGYRRRIMRKLGATSLPEIVKYAIRHHITPVAD